MIKNKRYPLLLKRKFFSYFLCSIIFNMKILIIEDEKKLGTALKKGLEKEGYVVDLAFDGEEAKYIIENNFEGYDLVILDIMLPKIDGISLCKDLRAKNFQAPILMLTAKDKVEDKILGLESGADDYLVKPFSYEELLARIRALLRRPKNLMPTVLKVKDISLDTVSKRVFRGDIEILLTNKEFAILEYLMRNVNRIISKEQIISHVWGYESDTLSNVVEAHIKNLRKKLERKRDENIIETIRGMGYRIKE